MVWQDYLSLPFISLFIVAMISFIIWLALFALVNHEYSNAA